MTVGVYRTMSHRRYHASQEFSGGILHQFFFGHQQATATVLRPDSGTVF